jgi:hypothetical protein
MPSQPERRPPLTDGTRRIPLMVTVSSDVHRALTRFGNRSDAIEQLVRTYIKLLPKPAKRPRRRPV